MFPFGVSLVVDLCIVGIRTVARIVFKGCECTEVGRSPGNLCIA